MASLADLLKHIKETGETLSKGYPRARGFADALVSNISKNVPSQADFQSPQAMSQWSQAAALNAPMGLTLKNLNAGLIQKYLKEGKLSPEEMAQYEKNALAMETPNLQKYNLENANLQGGTPENRAGALGFSIDAYHGTTDPDIKEFLPEGGGDLSKKTLDWYRNKKQDNKPVGYVNFRSGSFFSPKPEYAGNYTGENTGLLYPVKLKTDNPVQFFTERSGKLNLMNQPDKSKTIDAMILNNSLDSNDINEISIIDPIQIRSRFAAFDPLRKASSSLLASTAGAFTLADLLNQDRNR